MGVGYFVLATMKVTQMQRQKETKQKREIKRDEFIMPRGVPGLEKPEAAKETMVRETVVEMFPEIRRQVTLH